MLKPAMDKTWAPNRIYKFLRHDIIGVIFAVLLEAISKKVFSSELGVEPSSQVLDMLEYACG